MSTFGLDKLVTPNLRVLDLSYTPINSLPPSFSHRQNLYLLSLRGCSQLEMTLSPSPPSSNNSNKQASPLAHLGNLQVLDMNGVPLLELTKQDGNNKSNLQSGSKCTTLPTEVFCEMAKLEELILRNCSNLKESRGLKLHLLQKTCSKQWEACTHSS
jgi:Leucine-rich repeat (LRR) protein